MNMRAIHFSILETSLLSNAAIPLQNAFDIIAEAHKDNPDVVSLFTDLKADWKMHDPLPGESDWKLVTPFKKRESENPDFTVATGFVEISSVTTTIYPAWKELAYAFLIERKLATAAPNEIDIQTARYLLIAFKSGHPVEKTMLTWSQDPSWQKIADRTNPVDQLPEGFFKNFGDEPIAPAPFLIKEAIQKSLEESGAVDELSEIQKEWDWYTASYQRVEQGLLE